MRLGVTHVVCAAICLAIVPGARAAEVEASVPAETASSAGLLLQFRGLALARSETSADGREVTLFLKQPLDPNFVKDFQGRAPEWIESVSAGYDTLLLRTTKPARFETSPTPGGFTLRILRTGSSEDALRLKLVEARYLTSVGRTDEAREIVAELRRSQPDDIELLKASADADLADGDARAAADAYATALLKRPTDEDLRQGYATAEEGFAPRVEAGGHWQEIENADRQFRTHAQASTPVGERLTLRGRIETVGLDDDEVISPSGAVVAFDRTRVRGQVDLETDFGGGWFGVVSGFGARGVVGGGLSYERRAAYAQTAITAAYHQPLWDYSEGIVFAGTRDSVAISHREGFDNIWFVNLGLRANRFGIDGDDDVARSIEVDAGLRWRVLEGPTQVSLGYAYEGEFVDSVELRDDGMGNFFAPLPIADRQVHSGDVRVDSELAADLTAGAFAGYAYDVEGSSGLIAGLELAYHMTREWTVAMDAYYSAVGQRAGESGAYSQASITITRLFLTEGDDEIER